MPRTAGRSTPTSHLLLCAAFLASSAAAAEDAIDSLADLSLEQLGEIEIQVTSVSKKKERVLDAAASIFVISNEDIRRSGATSLPEALRLAPNLEVARLAGGTYAISARGFNIAGNKLQVLIDGRIIYSSLDSGVLWQFHDVMLEDVDRIEVISGPGGTLWGSNAVNGVINIITRSAKDTQGGLVALGYGDLRQDAAFRYGASLGEAGHVRFYGKGFHNDNTENADGTDRPDRWDRGQAGFRADWGRGGREITLQGDAYKGSLDQVFEGNQRMSGGNLLGRWSEPLQGSDRLTGQAYFAQADVDFFGGGGVPVALQNKTVQAAFEHSINGIEGHAIVWGADYRSSRDDIINHPNLGYLPAKQELTWKGLFVQDEIALRENLNLTLGVRAEDNDFTDVEFMPSARLGWKPTADTLLWTAYSRAVRTPSRTDRELYSPTTPFPVPPFPVPFLIGGGPTFRSETANIMELGFRAQPSPAINYSLTLFHHDYSHLRSVEVVLDPAVGLFAVGNEMEGKASGVEGWGSIQPTRNWRLSAGFVYLDMDLRMRPNSTDITGVAPAGNDPNIQWTIRSTVDLPGRIEFDVGIRHVGELPDPEVPEYTAVDARIGWWANRNLNLSISGQNLFDPGHPEFGAAADRSEIPRTVYASVLWRF